MTRGRRAAVVLAAAAVVAAALFLVLGRGEAEPALDASTSYDAFSTHRSGGEHMANASVYLYNRSDKPIQLQAAVSRTAGAKAPTRFRYLVAGPGRTDDVQGGIGFDCPPKYFKSASIKPLKGFTLEPDSTAAGKQGAVLITCFTVPAAPARFRFTDMTVSYLQDGEERSTTFPNNFRVCAAPGGKCDPDSTAQGDF